MIFWRRRKVKVIVPGVVAKARVRARKVVENTRRAGGAIVIKGYHSTTGRINHLSLWSSRLRPTALATARYAQATASMQGLLLPFFFLGQIHPPLTLVIYPEVGEKCSGL